MTSDLTERLHQIELELDAGIYRPGPWASFLQVAERKSQTERRAMTSDITRVSNKVHRRNHHTTVPLRTGLFLELLATVAGVLLLALGLDRLSAAAVLIAGAILTVTLQPLIKMTVGYLAGIRYAYFYFGGIEPRVKMRYGTYLAATRWRRVMLHLSGTVGSPLAFCWVATMAANDMPDTAAVCWALCWILIVVQVVLFMVVLSGARRSGLLGQAHLSSGGSAARELRLVGSIRTDR